MRANKVIVIYLRKKAIGSKAVLEFVQDHTRPKYLDIIFVVSGVKGRMVRLGRGAQQPQICLMVSASQVG